MSLMKTISAIKIQMSQRLKVKTFALWVTIVNLWVSAFQNNERVSHSLVFGPSGCLKNKVQKVKKKKSWHAIKTNNVAWNANSKSSYSQPVDYTFYS